jgi:ABC-type sugar transport system permease subunit
VIKLINELKHKKHFKLSLERKRGLFGYLFTLPFIIGLIFLYFSSLISSIIFSFNKVNIGTKGYSLSFVGIDNYFKALFVDPTFVRTELNTMAALFSQIVIVVIYALFISTILSQKMKGRGLIRAIFFLPVILSTGIIGQIEGQDLFAATSTLMNNAQTGILTDNTFLQSIDIKQIVSAIRISPQFITFIFSAVDGIYQIVKHSGVQMIIFLAGLQSINPSIYEAAYVEGCSGWEGFWKITLPMISPLIPVCTVWTIVEYFLNPANAVMQKIFGTAFNSTDYSLASAMAWINFAGMAFVVGLTLFIMSKFIFYENK